MKKRTEQVQSKKKNNNEAKQELLVLRKTMA